MVNAAIWFGASIFLVVALGAIFSPEIVEVFRKNGDTTKYYTGAVAMAVFHRYFVLQYICGIIAILHLVAEKLYLGRALPRLGIGLVGLLLFMALVGGWGVQPRIEKLRADKYANNVTAEQRAKAEHSLDTLHAVSVCINVFAMAGLLVHLLRVTRPEESRHYGTLFPQFRG